MAMVGKTVRRAIKRVTLGWRQSMLDKSPAWLRSTFGTPASYLDMLLVDHGIFRVFYSNRHRLGDEAWRSAQPAPHQIAALRRLGIRTVVNLRGERLCGSYWLERSACTRYGIKLVDFQIRSRAAPTKAEFRAVRQLFETLEYPILMHCKSGADRVGLMSVLYRHIRQGEPIEQAKQQLSLRYGHIRQADTGILDAVFERYLADARTEPMSFFDWVEARYDPDQLQRSFRASNMANRLVNSILRRE